MKQQIYIDTSVVGGYFDKEFEADTKKLFKEIEQGKYQVILSEVLEKELENAPDKVKTLLKDLKIKDIQEVSLNNTIIELAKQYLHEGVVGATSYDDCLHIATATYNNVNF